MIAWFVGFGSALLPVDTSCLGAARNWFRARGHRRGFWWRGSRDQLDQSKKPARDLLGLVFRDRIAGLPVIVMDFLDEGGRWFDWHVGLMNDGLCVRKKTPAPTECAPHTRCSMSRSLGCGPKVRAGERHDMVMLQHAGTRALASQPTDDYAGRGSLCFGDIRVGIRAYSWFCEHFGSE